MSVIKPPLGKHGNTAATAARIAASQGSPDLLASCNGEVRDECGCLV